MTTNVYLPQVTYLCVFPETPRNQTRKGRKRVTVSERYQFTGYVHVEDVRYRVRFLNYDDIDQLPTLTTKKSILAIYGFYAEGIALREGQCFSPVIDAPKGGIGEPAVIPKDQFYWLPYLTLSMTGTAQIRVGVHAIEAETGDVIDLMTLETKPRQLLYQFNKSPRWVWRNADASDEDHDAAA